MVDVMKLRWHYRAMIGKTKTPPKRKPLRQRVADRKAGRDRYVEEEPSVLLWRKRLTRLAFGMQALGLVGLIYALVQFVGTDYLVVPWNIVIYSMLLFIVGRVVKAGIDIQRAAARNR